MSNSLCSCAVPNMVEEMLEKNEEQCPKDPRKWPKIPMRKQNVPFSNYSIPPSRTFQPEQYNFHRSYQYPGQWESGPQSDWSNSRSRWNCEPESHFVKSAEANVRDAFASIESIVTTFTSVAHMLEATYTSVHSSFRAVLTVADHFTTLRHKLAKILRSFLMLGIGHRVYKKLCRLISSSSSKETIQNVTREFSNPSDGQDIWPFITFLLVACAGPYLVYKMFPSAREDDPEDETGDESAAVLYPYRALNPDEMSVPVDAEVTVAPPHLQPGHIRGWTLVGFEGAVGLVPTSYLELNT